MQMLGALGMKWRIMLLLWLCGILAAGGLSWDRFPLVERDFANLWTAGRLAFDGRPVDAYDAAELRLAATHWLGTTSNLVFPYPPQLLLILAPLSVLPYRFAFGIWGALSAILFALAAKPYVPRGFPLLLAVLTPAALINLLYGQVGLMFGALWLFAFRGSWIAAAALTFKPHLGALVALKMLNSRRVTATLAAIAAILSTVVLLFGASIFAAFWAALEGQAELLAQGSMTSWRVRIVSPLTAYGPFGWAAFATAAVILLARRFDAFTAATASMLISPYGFHYDMPVVCLGFGIALYRHWYDARPWQRISMGVGFLTPILVIFGSWLIPPILLVALFAQTRLNVPSDFAFPAWSTQNQLRPAKS
jgi:hypothetical protein